MKVIFHSGKYLFDDTAPIASSWLFNARDKTLPSWLNVRSPKFREVTIF